MGRVDHEVYNTLGMVTLGHKHIFARGVVALNEIDAAGLTIVDTP